MPVDEPKPEGPKRVRLRPGAISLVPTDPETPKRLADLVEALTTPAAKASKTKVIELGIKELWERVCGKAKGKRKGE